MTKPTLQRWDAEINGIAVSVYAEDRESALAKVVDNAARTIRRGQ